MVAAPEKVGDAIVGGAARSGMENSVTVPHIFKRLLPERTSALNVCGIIPDETVSGRAIKRR